MKECNVHILRFNHVSFNFSYTLGKKKKILIDLKEMISNWKSLGLPEKKNVIFIPHNAFLLYSFQKMF